MSVGFGFSASDFIAGIELVATVIDALRESGDSSQRYRELISELYSLETALLQVKRLELHESQNASQIALRSAASQCQRTITDFWQSVQKYHPSLGSSSRSMRLRDQWIKVKWALFKEEEVEKFKADLRGHTGSINILLASCRILYQQGGELLQMTAVVVQTNIRIFYAILDIQAWMKQIPGQIQHQQPVLFLDALGRRQHFHLDFIQCFDALLAVLRANFQMAGVGVKKIDRREFVLRDRFRHVDINLNQPWERCFRPGQTVSDKKADEEAEWQVSYLPS
ncbi:hypothetical protein ACJ41O_000844 [Fusarium nematophilum]